MISACKQNLDQLITLLNVINEQQYTYKSRLLDGASIGQHIRHVLEFYDCLIKSDTTQELDYDKRNREYLIEQSPNAAFTYTARIIEHLSNLDESRSVTLKGRYELESDHESEIKSTVGRELLYNLEHSIHHQALIKVSLNEQGITHLTPKNFGIAPSTIRYRKVCAQ